MSARARALASRAREAQERPPAGAPGEAPAIGRGHSLWRTLIVASAMAAGVGLVIYLLSPSEPSPDPGPEDPDPEPARRDPTLPSADETHDHTSFAATSTTVADPATAPTP